MSRVANVIVAVRFFEGTKEVLEQIVNGYFDDKNRYPWDFKRMTRLTGYDENRPFGGNKHLECDLFVGAFNHLDIEEYVSYLVAVPWGPHDEVQFIVCDQEDDGFRIIDVHRPAWWGSP